MRKFDNVWGVPSSDRNSRMLTRNSWWVLLCVATILSGAFAQNNKDDVPEGLKPPSGFQLVLQGHATGDQIYVCQTSATGDPQFAWTLRGPEAKLTDAAGKEIVKHYAGPTWQSEDGSMVKGKLVSQVAPDPNSIPWLLLTVVDHGGSGVMSDVRAIQRLNTQGGKAPETGCDAQHKGEETRVSYSADYYFYGPGK